MTKNKGTTVIEMIVIIAIVGILASVIMSALGDANSDSPQDSCARFKDYQAQAIPGRCISYFQ